MSQGRVDGLDARRFSYLLLAPHLSHLLLAPYLKSLVPHLILGSQALLNGRFSLAPHQKRRKLGVALKKNHTFREKKLATHLYWKSSGRPSVRLSCRQLTVLYSSSSSSCIMRDKVALNLPVVYTKRTNKKLAEVHMCSAVSFLDAGSSL